MKHSRRERKWLLFACAMPLFLLGSGAFWLNFNATPVVNIPNPPLPKPNAYDFFVKAGAACIPVSPAVLDMEEKANPSNPATMSQYLKPAVLADVRKNVPALALLRKGFAYEYRQPAQRTFNIISLPFLARCREISRALKLESNVRAARGDCRGATQSALDILRLTYDFPRGGSSIVALSAASQQDMGTERLTLLLPHLDSPTCRVAARQLEKFYDQRVPYWETLQEEKWLAQVGLLEMMRQPNWRTAIMQEMGYKGAAQQPTFVLMSKRAMMNSHTAFMDQLIANARLSYAKSPPPPPASDFYSAMVEPTYFNMRCFIARREAASALLMVALAIRAYQLETGTLPETLSQLTPSYLKAIPTDPFGSGEPLRYKKQSATYVLWSIGPDKTDGGGQPAPNPSPALWEKDEAGRYLIKPDSKGDFAFGINH